MMNPLFLMNGKKKAQKLFNLCKMVLTDQTGHYPPAVITFENKFSAWIGCRHGLTFCNGTSALEAALFAINIKPEDEVIVPSHTFHASIGPIVNSGAQPVFADILEDTLTIDPQDIEKKITARTRCLLIVHPWGNPADIDSILTIAKKYSLKVIEDCSHAHGASWKGKKVGSLGDIGCFSLASSKPISVGEGGIAVTDNHHYFERLSLFGHFGRIKDNLQNKQYQCLLETGVGYKRRANPLGICLASVDLSSIEEENNAKQKSEDKIKLIVDSIKGITPIESYPEAKKGGFYNGVPLLINKKAAQSISPSAVVKKLTRDKISSKTHTCGLYHHFHHLKNLDYRKAVLENMEGNRLPLPDDTLCLPVTEDITNRVFFLAIQPAMPDYYFKKIALSLKDLFSRIDHD